MKLGPRLCVLFLSIPSVAITQDLVPIVDAAKTSASNADSVVTEYMSSPVVELASSRYDIMQNLQEEVRMLRGLVEELSYDLQQVKQRQLDDYLDLDRRLGLRSNINESAVSDRFTSPVAILDSEDAQAGLASSGTSAGMDVSTSPVGVTSDLVDDESLVKADYNAASKKLLKERDIEGAAVALKMHLETYPGSPFAANAHYWLGEIYLLQGDTEFARQAFTNIVERHADHPKAMDSRFKLGKIYFQLGEVDRARNLLEKVAQSPGGAAAKARNFLDKNLQ
jgi:tol-pal system protein YbgF|tara:strand:+ start:6809 stop:7651 length:843 start_codon:yes stop_codon:yes gene_type:complete